nr:Sec-independent protein translocase subunit TatA [Kibdelosporangium sp. MJ126-NF4]CEL20427.1 Twin-arginine translocation protein TatA [Kibdelosporangium sp. MJ126-NF4]CTQ97652.1 Twin-arginine translocation protein TatA [Kibdelosporangium sp. MJ126-NF4]
MGNLGPTELIIIAVVIILLFGAKKMPDMARSLGRSMRIIKAETKGMKQDEQPEGTAQADTTATAATPAPAVTPAPAAPVQLPQAAPAAQSDVEKMQKQIDELQAKLKNDQSAPTQAPKNA